MRHITTDQLKQMTQIEGLVLQGCGGNLDEWVSGINEVFTQEGILLNGDTFKDIYAFEHGGLTNMLFSMDDVSLNVGKLAMWRLSSHDTFGGTWLSDYIENQFGVRTEQPETDCNNFYNDEKQPNNYENTAVPFPVAQVKNTDLAAIVYKIRALAGDHMKNAQHNVNKFADGSEHYLMFMNERKIFLCETGAAYQRDTTAHEDLMLWDMDAKAFALHVAERENGHICGNMYAINFKQLREDIRSHSFDFTHVDARLNDGSEKRYTPEEWKAMELIDRDKLQSWTRHYDTREVINNGLHLKRLTNEWSACGKCVSPDKFLTDLNRAYMDGAKHPQPDMLRIAPSAGMELLAREDCPVYRLLPEGAARLSPIDAIKTGLSYSTHREFAVKHSGMAGIDKWAERSTCKILRCERTIPEKNKFRGDER